MPIRPRSGSVARRAPEKIMLQFGGARVFEAEHLAALRIDARHHMLDGAVLSRRIHRLKDQQDRMAVGRIEKLLLRAQLCDMLLEQLLICGLRVVDWLDVGRPFREVDVVAFAHAKVF